MTEFTVNPETCPDCDDGVELHAGVCPECGTTVEE